MSGSKRGLQLFRIMEIGELVPTEVVLDILSEAMAAKVEGATGFLIDGFPLNLEEAEMFEKQVVPVTRIVHMHIPSDVMVDRLTKRVQIYEQKTLPVLEKYCHKVVKVSADRSVPEVAEDMLKALQGELEGGGRSVL